MKLFVKTINFKNQPIKKSNLNLNLNNKRER